MITDKISMTEREAFGQLDLVWKAITPNFLSCDRVLLLVVEVFLQVASVNQNGVYVKASKCSYRSYKKC